MGQEKWLKTLWKRPQKFPPSLKGFRFDQILTIRRLWRFPSGGLPDPESLRPFLIPECAARHERQHPFWPLGQNLKSMPGSDRHQGKNPGDEFVRNIRMEKIAHGIHEDLPGPLPAERLVEPIRVTGDILEVPAGIGRYEP
jgi:hypothetical protein